MALSSSIVRQDHVLLVSSSPVVTRMASGFQPPWISVWIVWTLVYRCLLKSCFQALWDRCPGKWSCRSHGRSLWPCEGRRADWGSCRGAVPHSRVRAGACWPVCVCVYFNRRSEGCGLACHRGCHVLVSLAARDVERLFLCVWPSACLLWRNF